MRLHARSVSVKHNNFQFAVWRNKLRKMQNTWHSTFNTFQLPTGYTWRFGLVVRVCLDQRINIRRARLVLGWVTASGVQLPVREIYLSI